MLEQEQSEEKFSCPKCDFALLFSEEPLKVFSLDLIRTRASCQKCGFSIDDLIIKQSQAPRGYNYSVRTSEDLKATLILSSTTFLRIDKLGLVVEPGPESKGFIGTLGDFLRMHEKNFEKIADLAEEQHEKELARKEAKRYSEARLGRNPFDIVIKDLNGNCAILGSKAKNFDLDSSEIEELKNKLELADY
jgi:ZPR1 zinc finger protein